MMIVFTAEVHPWSCPELEIIAKEWTRFCQAESVDLGELMAMLDAGAAELVDALTGKRIVWAEGVAGAEQARAAVRVLRRLGCKV